MKIRPILFSLAFGLASVCFASPQIGTWKLNESKSKLSPDAPRHNTVIYTAVGNGVKVTVDGTDKSGRAIHNEWTGKFDGKDYPVTGDPSSDSRSYKEVDAHTVELTLKKNGNVVGTGRIVVSTDGKSRSVNIVGTNADGKKFTSLSVYDKQ
jgi:hypothetical protein